MIDCVIVCLVVCLVVIVDSHTFWSQLASVANNELRTNNAIEGWNFSLNNMSACHHPHVFKIVELIHADIDNSMTRMVQTDAGVAVQP